MTHLHALLAVAVGIALVVAGLVWLFGPFGLLAAGVPLIVVGLLIDPEGVTHGEPADTPARRR